MHTWLKNIQCNRLKYYCENSMNNLMGDYISACKNTRMNFKLWKEKRKFRITSSKYYDMYTL